MKILTGSRIREADRYTVENEPVEPLSLVERAAEAIAQAIANRTDRETELLFFIGKGNNGGDGLAVARMLSNAGFNCSVVQLFPAADMSTQCRTNLERLPKDVRKITGGGFTVDGNTVVVDAVLGSGVKGELSAYLKEVVDTINGLGCEVISIDLPSGMKTEFGNDPDLIVHAGVTLTLEFPKVPMLLPESGECCGEIEVLPIGLDPGYLENAESGFYYVDSGVTGGILSGRRKFSHKGDYGHALLVCGSKGMAGAAVLAAGGALRSGCGLVTVHISGEYASAVYANAPSAMVSHDPADCFSASPPETGKYTVCGIGPGLGRDDRTIAALEQLMTSFRKPMVIDADALNIIASRPGLRKLIPRNSVLTPHPGELERLTGMWRDDEEKISLTRQLAAELDCVIVVKGAHTMTCVPEGDIYFNYTGTPGMAKGGSGDVLTGLITGLIARGYAPREAAVTGVYIHGRAGELAEEYYGTEAMNSGDLPDFIAEAMKEADAS